MTIAELDGIARDFGISQGISDNDQIKRDWFKPEDIIEIEEKSGVDLTNYQVLLEKEINENDRFTHQGRSLDYWKESESKAWIEVDKLHGSMKHRLIRWSNPSASSASDGDSVFEFFDDFDRPDGEPGAAWTIDGGTWAINNNKLRQSGTTANEFIRTTSFAILNGIIEVDAILISGKKMGGIVGRYQDTNNFYSEEIGGASHRTNLGARYNSGSTSTLASVGSVDDLAYNTIYHLTLKIKDVNPVDLDVNMRNGGYNDNLSYDDSSSNRHTTEGYVGLRTWGGTVDFDNFRVRKYADPEPSVKVKEIA